MDYDSLSEDSKAYIDRYCRAYGKTREQATEEILVLKVIVKYERKRKGE